MAAETIKQTGKWPLHGWLGLALVALFWTLNWTFPGSTPWGFFSLWLGYCLTVDALVFFRKGHSLLTRSPTAYAGLFIVSAPAWWLFELINLRTQNWLYIGEEEFTTLEYAFFASLSFSTVIPAVFGTAEWAGSWGRIKRLRPGFAINPAPAVLLGMFAAGCLMLLMVTAWPEVFFPLVWISLYCLIEPLNRKIGNRSLLDDLARGDWRPAAALAAGCLICGFFWEMWNFYSYPKWVYRIPYAGWLRVFEMPLAGYLGYLPFSLELFALYHLIAGIILRGGNRHYLRLSEGDV